MNIDSSAFFQAMLGANVSLMSISITLVTFVSVLIEFASQRKNDFLSTEFSKKTIKNGLSKLRMTIWLYGIGIILSTAGLFFSSTFQTIITILLISIAILFFLSTLVLVLVSYILTSTALNALS